jgi:hypothetical protein
LDNWVGLCRLLDFKIGIALADFTVPAMTINPKLIGVHLEY